MGLEPRCRITASLWLWSLIIILPDLLQGLCVDELIVALVSAVVLGLVEAATLVGRRANDGLRFVRGVHSVAVWVMAAGAVVAALAILACFAFGLYKAWSDQEWAVSIAPEWPEWASLFGVTPRDFFGVTPRDDAAARRKGAASTPKAARTPPSARHQRNYAVFSPMNRQRQPGSSLYAVGEDLHALAEESTRDLRRERTTANKVKDGVPSIALDDDDGDGVEWRSSTPVAPSYTTSGLALRPTAVELELERTAVEPFESPPPRRTLENAWTSPPGDGDFDAQSERLARHAGDLLVSSHTDNSIDAIVGALRDADERARRV